MKHNVATVNEPLALTMVGATKVGTVCTREHQRPVHYDRGQFGHVWLCLHCKKQLAGPTLSVDEREVLIEFTLVLTKDFKRQSRRLTKRREVMLTPALLAKALRAAANVLEKAKVKAAVAEEPEADTDESDDDEDFAPKKKAKKKAAASFDDDDDDEAAESDDDDEEPAPKKKSKAPKYSVEDVNDACKNYGKENGRPAVMTILKKKFKVESVSDLKPEQFGAVIAAMEV